MSEEDRERLGHFNASDHWVTIFFNRYNLKSFLLRGEASSIDEKAIASSMAAVRKECENYDLDCIYNVDETGLFYLMLPRRTCLAPGENRKVARGVKGMKAKERLTVYIGVNASGTAKMPLAFIGTAANPRCFGENKRLLPKDDIYLQHARAWSDTRTFGLWFKTFLLFVRRITSKPVLILMDNHSSHASLEDPRGQIKAMKYPPNCTSKHQPADDGII